MKKRLFRILLFKSFSLLITLGIPLLWGLEDLGSVKVELAEGFLIATSLSNFYNYLNLMKVKFNSFFIIIFLFLLDLFFAIVIFGEVFHISIFLFFLQVKAIDYIRSEREISAQFVTAIIAPTTALLLLFDVGVVIIRASTVFLAIIILIKHGLFKNDSYTFKSFDIIYEFKYLFLGIGKPLKENLMLLIVSTSVSNIDVGYLVVFRGGSNFVAGLTSEFVRLKSFSKNFLETLKNQKRLRQLSSLAVVILGVVWTIIFGLDWFILFSISLSVITIYPPPYNLILLKYGLAKTFLRYQVIQSVMLFSIYLSVNVGILEARLSGLLFLGTLLTITVLMESKRKTLDI